MRKTVLFLMMLVLVLPSCGSMSEMRREDRIAFGAHIGAFSGSVFGGIIGLTIDDEFGADVGSLVGTAVGGVAGAGIAASVEDEEKPVERTVEVVKPVSQVPLPDLQIEDILLEEDSATCDGKINAGETCRIALVIVNNSLQAALDVTPVVEVTEGEGLWLSDPVKISKITRDDCITYRVAVEASPELATGQAVFSVRLDEKYGYGTEPETFTVETTGD